MTRKDYQLIASAIHQVLQDMDSDDYGLSSEAKKQAEATVSQVVYRLSEALYGDNTRFDIYRFCKEVGVNPYISL